MNHSKLLDQARALALKAKPWILKHEGDTYTAVYSMSQSVYEVFKNGEFYLNINDKSPSKAKSSYSSILQTNQPSTKGKHHVKLYQSNCTILALRYRYRGSVAYTVINLNQSINFLRIKTMSIQQTDFTRIRNDVNGNPRYVCHFLHLDTYGYDSDLTVSQRYTEAVSLANNLGGKKYHTKTYGGGIVFQSYNLRHLCEMINDLTNKMEA